MKLTINNLEDYILRHHMVTPAQSVLLAVSGGVDSMVMLDLFAQLHERLKLQVSIIHINHQMRGDESAEDERFVKDMSESYRVSCYCERVDVHSYAHERRLSKQAAARQLRYECFERLRHQLNADAVATAHHADDNAETVLLNILRGTGIHGLAGIPPKRDTGHIIRPLLFTTRKEIELYATEHNIKFRTDSSNQSLAYSRNLLRHKIIPALRMRVPHIVQTLNQIAVTMRDVDEHVRVLVRNAMVSLVHTDSCGHCVLEIKKLQTVEDFLWDEILLEILNQLQIEPTEKKVVALHRLCTLTSGRVIELTDAWYASRDRENIIFHQQRDEIPHVQQVEFGREYDYHGFLVSLSKPEPVPTTFSRTCMVEYIDAEQLGKRTILRPWKSGDWFIPLGMKTKKKLSDFFIDQKVPRYQKTSIPVLESDGAIVWICGKRLDDRFKLTKSTKTAIRLTYHQST